MPLDQFFQRIIKAREKIQNMDAILWPIVLRRDDLLTLRIYDHHRHAPKIVYCLVPEIRFYADDL